MREHVHGGGFLLFFFLLASEFVLSLARLLCAALHAIKGCNVSYERVKEARIV